MGIEGVSRHPRPPGHGASGLAFARRARPPGSSSRLTGTGRSRVRYVQAGRILSLAFWPTPGGGFLAAGGVSRERQQGTLALLRESDPPAAFPGFGAREISCDNCPAATPRRLFLFPGSELTALSRDKRTTKLQTCSSPGRTLKLELNDGLGSAIGMMEPDFSISSLEFSDRHWTAHRDLEKSGALDHPIDSCPERHGAWSVQGWTAERGWHTEAILRANFKP